MKEPLKVSLMEIAVGKLIGCKVVDVKRPGVSSTDRSYGLVFKDEEGQEYLLSFKPNNIDYMC